MHGFELFNKHIAVLFRCQHTLICLPYLKAQVESVGWSRSFDKQHVWIGEISAYLKFPSRNTKWKLPVGGLLTRHKTRINRRKAVEEETEKREREIAGFSDLHLVTISLFSVSASLKCMVQSPFQGISFHPAALITMPLDSYFRPDQFVSYWMGNSEISKNAFLTFK